jgi:hypothetical protein
VKKVVHYGSIYLPHINYTVRVQRFKPAPHSIAGAIAWTRRDDKLGCTVFLPKIETPGGVAHEFVHALRFICIDRHMLFDDESEHMAYIMQYLMGQVFNYSWVKRPRKRRRKK